MTDKHDELLSRAVRAHKKWEAAKEEADRKREDMC